MKITTCPNCGRNLHEWEVEDHVTKCLHDSEDDLLSVIRSEVPHNRGPKKKIMKHFYTLSGSRYCDVTFPPAAAPEAIRRSIAKLDKQNPGIEVIVKWGAG